MEEKRRLRGEWEEVGQRGLQKMGLVIIVSLCLFHISKYCSEGQIKEQCILFMGRCAWHYREEAHLLTNQSQ